MARKSHTLSLLFLLFCLLISGCVSESTDEQVKVNADLVPVEEIIKYFENSTWAHLSYQVTDSKIVFSGTLPTKKDKASFQTFINWYCAEKICPEIKWELNTKSEIEEPKKFSADIQSIFSDSRIDSSALPKAAGQYGLSKYDVETIWLGAKVALNNDLCGRILDADKSVSKAGKYYLNCGRQKNEFFSRSGDDIYFPSIGRHISPNKISAKALKDSINVTMYVSGSTVNVRNAPNGNKLGGLDFASKVTVYEKKDDWARVSPSKNKPRWVSLSHLQSSKPEPLNVKTITKGICSKAEIRTYVLSGSEPSHCHLFPQRRCTSAQIERWMLTDWEPTCDPTMRK